MEVYRGPRLAYSASGARVDLDRAEAEAAKQAERERSRRAELEARRAERRPEAEERRRAEAAWLEANRPANLIPEGGLT